MEEFETVKYKGFKIRIYQDFDPINPREDDGNLTVIACWHRRINLGDRQIASQNDADDLVEELGDCLTIKPLYIYDHGDITISLHPFGDPWDSGQVGFVFVPRKQVCEVMGWKIVTKKRREWLMKQVELEIKVYDQYLRGECYGYEVEDDNDESIDSCGGFLGSDHEKSGLLDMARGAVDHVLRQKEEAQWLSPVYLGEFCETSPL